MNRVRLMLLDSKVGSKNVVDVKTKLTVKEVEDAVAKTVAFYNEVGFKDFLVVELLKDLQRFGVITVIEPKDIAVATIVYK